MSEEVLDPPQVFGGYLLLAALGRGAMGDVFLARPLSADRGVPTPVVVKRLHGDLASKPGFVARFRHEAAVAVSVDSPHVAKVYDVGAVGETLYIALEYVPGWPLSKVLDAVLESGRHASVASVVDLIAGGLAGLHALHTARDAKTGLPLEIVHRDLSPKNLMVGEDGQMRVIDLGLGKSNAQDWRTRTGVVMGSVGYMPPEQVRGERVDARADVFAMGVVAFEMLALRNYIPRGTVSQMMEASAAPAFVRPSEFRPDVPKELDRVIDRALRPDRELRFGSAQDFLRGLRAVVPPAYTQGSMVTLLEEIFGDSRATRAAMLARLLEISPPDDFETRPTKVFVLRAGVGPLEDTQISGLGDSEDDTALASTPGMVRDPGRPPQQKTQEELPKTAHALSPPEARHGGVSVPMLLGAVLAAAVLGGIVSMVLLLAVLDHRDEARTATSERRGSTPISTPRPTPRPRPTPTSKVVELPPPALDPDARPAPVREARGKIAATRKSARRAPAEADASRAASAPVKEGDVNQALDRLASRARAAREAAQSVSAKSRATQVLLDIAVWRRSKDVRRKWEAVQELEARLGAP